MFLSVSVLAVLFLPGGKTFFISLSTSLIKAEWKVTHVSSRHFYDDLLSTCGYLFVPAWGQSSSSRLGVVVEAKNITLPAGSKADLPCHSPRMVWTRDRLKDRQRVVHWDLVRSSPDYSVERVLDMSPGARQRVYNGFNKGRISIPESAFNDGNFSLIINSETSLLPRSTSNISLFSF